MPIMIYVRENLENLAVNAGLPVWPVTSVPRTRCVSNPAPATQASGSVPESRAGFITIVCLVFTATRNMIIRRLPMLSRGFAAKDSHNILIIKVVDTCT